MPVIVNSPSRLKKQGPHIQVPYMFTYGDDISQSNYTKITIARIANILYAPSVPKTHIENKQQVWA